jgi:hypothetical protein
MIWRHANRTRRARWFAHDPSDPYPTRHPKVTRPLAWECTGVLLFWTQTPLSGHKNTNAPPRTATASRLSITIVIPEIYHDSPAQRQGCQTPVLRSIFRPALRSRSAAASRMRPFPRSRSLARHLPVAPEVANDAPTQEVRAEPRFVRSRRLGPHLQETGGQSAKAWWYGSCRQGRRARCEGGRRRALTIAESAFAETR